MSWKDLRKLAGVAVIAGCAVFVCTLFLNYNLDVVLIREQLTGAEGQVLYNAIVAMGKMVAAISGGCLAVTAGVMLLFFVKNYVDAHGKELGILSALGYTAAAVAARFWVFGMSVFVGCGVGFAGAFAYMPAFYAAQNSQGLFPSVAVRFHTMLAVCLVIVPTVVFALLAIGCAYGKLRAPVLSLLRQTPRRRLRVRREKEDRDRPFLQELRRQTLRSRKMPVFLVAFSAFCFSAMVQMSMSMDELSSESFSFLILSIGLLLAFMTLFLALASVVNANGKSVALMKVFGYTRRECGEAVFGGYRVISYAGFAVGTVYQYVLLKIVVTTFFADFEAMPTYHFSWRGVGICLLLFIVVYELALHIYTAHLQAVPVQSVMAEE